MKGFDSSKDTDAVPEDSEVDELAIDILGILGPSSSPKISSINKNKPAPDNIFWIRLSSEYIFERRIIGPDDELSGSNSPFSIFSSIIFFSSMRLTALSLISTLERSSKS